MGTIRKRRKGGLLIRSPRVTRHDRRDFGRSRDARSAHSLLHRRTWKAPPAVLVLLQASSHVQFSWKLSAASAMATQFGQMVPFVLDNRSGQGIPKLRLLGGGGLGPSDCENYLKVLRGNDLQAVCAILRKLETLARSVLGDHSQVTLVDGYSELV